MKHLIEVMFVDAIPNFKINHNKSEMKEKYLAIEIHGEIFVMNNSDELGGLIDKGIPHAIVGRICAEECNTTCLHYRGGTCPCKAMKDTHGNLIHVFV